MSLTTIPKLSADCHVDEPHDLWFDRLPEGLRERAPRRIEAGGDGGWSLVLDGSDLGWGNLNPAAAEEQEQRRWSAATVDHRLDMMREDGIRGEIIFPTIGLYIWRLDDGDLGRRCCHIYNDWVRERLVGQSDRVKCAAMMSIWDVDECIEDAELAAAQGFGAIMLPLVGTPEWNMPEWERLWDALDDLGLPIAMHQGSGHDMVAYRGWGSSTANLLTTQSMGPRAAALLSCSGILERHPNLHFVFVEVNGGWVAWAMHTLDEYYRDHAGWAKPKLAEPPSFYIRRQIHVTFQNDPIALNNVQFTGSSPLMWGNDYPHPESTFPHSQEIIAGSFGHLSTEDASAILGGNAARVFGFEDSVVATAP
ncbi:MAG: amidohydrolase family protein [Acidimicrobiales bacterium]|nr:amidohydrolase family protein [Acidimicrobiales bacterium]